MTNRKECRNKIRLISIITVILMLMNLVLLVKCDLLIKNNNEIYNKISQLQK